MNINPRNILTSLTLLGVIVLTACSTDNEYSGSRQTHAGFIAFGYLEKSMRQQTDLLTLARSLQQRLDNDETPLPPGISIQETTDPANGQTLFTLHYTSIDSQQPSFSIMANGKPVIGQPWKLQTHATHKGETVIYDITITPEDADNWAIEGQGTPLCLYYTAHTPCITEEPSHIYDESFISKNLKGHIQWDQIWVGQLTLSGQMESVATPTMVIRYNTPSPILFYPDNGYAVSHWQQGRLTFTVEDVLDNTHDLTEATFDSRNVRISQDGQTATWTYAP